MSVYNHFLLQNTPQGNTINPGVLFEAGPIINIEISIPKALADVYSQTGQTIPQPKIGIALIDTGAKKSCVHDSIMQDLGVSTIGQVMSGTANGQRPCKLFPAFFNFPGTGISVDFTSVVEVNLSGQIINGEQIIALVGRDLLANTIFVYNGRVGLYTLFTIYYLSR